MAPGAHTPPAVGGVVGFPTRSTCIGRSVAKLGCTSVTKLKYTPRHCFVTQCKKTLLCHAVRAGVLVTKMLPEHLSITPHELPRHKKLFAP